MEKAIILIVGTAIVTAIVTLIGRYVWDRYMAKSSRVTVAEHEKDVHCLKERLIKGTQTFKEISVCLSTICVCQLELCEQMNMDCSKIKEIMIKNGIAL